MKEVRVLCPECRTVIKFRNWFQWVLCTPYHWFGKRLTQCVRCGKWSYMKREK